MVDADGDGIPLMIVMVVMVMVMVMVIVMVDLLMVRKRWLMLMVMEYHSGVWKQLRQKPSPDFKAFMTTLIMIIFITFELFPHYQHCHASCMLQFIITY